MSGFLFDMLALLAASADQFSDQYKQDCVLYFQMLNDLVTGLNVSTE
jgi:hypothetical protein